MAFSFYKAYISGIAKPPQEDWQESYQQSADTYWENTSTVAVIQAQNEVGGVEYSDESVQLTSIISPTTGESFGDRYRKIVHKDYVTTDNWLGKMYQFEDAYWLTINTNTRIGSVKTSIVQFCNNVLKWIAKDGSVKSWNCVYTRNITSTNFVEGSQNVAQVNADAKIIVQRNAETELIPFNQRFLFDGHAFQVKQIDNHYSDTLMSIYIFEVPLQVDDDIKNNLAGGANYTQPVGEEIKILPNITKILQGNTQAFSVYNYVDGVATADTFSITASNAPSDTYTIETTDNGFSVTNLKQTPIPLVVTCTDNVTSTTIVKNIVLGGDW